MCTAEFNDVSVIVWDWTQAYCCGLVILLRWTHGASFQEDRTYTKMVQPNSPFLKP